MSKVRGFSLAEARRIALAAQGLDRPRPSRRIGAAQLGQVIRRLGLLQLDFVNVLVPAHYVVPFSRLGSYRRSLLDEVVYGSGKFTEQWAHEASILPVDSWPLLRHRMAAHRVRPWGFEKILKKHAEYVSWALDQVRERGPLTADDLPELDGAPKRISDAWGWGLNVKRQVLEAHLGFGRLAVARRLPNFARVYELAERLIPERLFALQVEREEAQRRLLLQAAAAHGIGTAADLADYYRMPVRDARPRLDELIATKKLVEVQVEGWREPALLHPEAEVPRAAGAAALLSPFDPLIWFRPRTERLFAFDYRLEIFVPKERRRWGYYVLPFLQGERLVARVDLKADRDAGCLQVLAAHPEAGGDLAQVAKPLAAELRAMAAWLGLETVSVARRGSLAAHLSRAMA